MIAPVTNVTVAKISALCYAPRMLDLSQETEALARRLAAAQRLSVDDAIRVALEEHARRTGLSPESAARERRAWRIEEIPEEYIALIRQAEAPEEAQVHNGEVPQGWTGR